MLSSRLGSVLKASTFRRSCPSWLKGKRLGPIVPISETSWLTKAGRTLSPGLVKMPTEATTVCAEVYKPFASLATVPW